uniref:Aminopeptidase n=1 Tax=Rhabditophanes sp. KR3021 TaxID=114890 RepID=A0AC35TFT3_9BILA
MVQATTNVEEKEVEQQMTTDSKPCPNEFRLGTKIEPISYDVSIYPNLDTLKVEGNVTIHINVLESTDLILIHGALLKMVRFKVKVNDKKMKADFSYCTKHDQWAFELEDNINSGDEVKLSIYYHGQIQTDLSGLYLNTHKYKDGKTKISAITQFEPTHARKMIPCFDEPSFKAVFNMTVIRNPEHTVRANMPINYSDIWAGNNSLMIDRFTPSVKMSTYLLAVAILDDFKKVRRYTKNTSKPIEINLYAPSDTLPDQSEFGLDTGVRALEFFENYFEFAFPLKKTDMVALDDFEQAAMESFGLITFRDTMLLYHENNSTARYQQHIASVICHEFGHQYFGNTVTMRHWNDLWLNEGFCNYMQYICGDALYPEWKVMDLFYQENFVYSMHMDGLLSSHAVSTPVENPAEISSLFDHISYQKGAIVIGMMRKLSGPVAFQNALKEYLVEFAYKNVDSNDLWRMLQKHVDISADVTIKEMAEAWTLQTGFPMVYVTHGRASSEIVVHNQTRFLYLENDRKVTGITEWPIPVHFVTDSIKDSRMAWLKPGQKNLRIDLGKPSRWFLANSESTGFYRVLYDKGNYHALSKQLKSNHRKIKAVDRSVLLNDAFSFVKSGHLCIQEAFDLLEYVHRGVEKDRTPWFIISTHLRYIDMLLLDTNIYPTFQDFKRHLLLKTYENLSWEKPHTNNDKIFQSEILAAACNSEIVHCTKQSKLLFKKWSKNRSLIAVDLQQFIIEEGVRKGGAQEWELVYKEFLRSKSPAQKAIYLNALTQTTDIKLIYRMLNMALDTSKIKAGVLPTFMKFLMSNRVASAHVWRYFRVNFDKFNKVVGKNASLMASLLRNLVEQFSTPYDLAEVKALFKEKKLEIASDKIEQTIHSIMLNIQWRYLNEKALSEWLVKWEAKQYVREGNTSTKKSKNV